MKLDPYPNPLNLQIGDWVLLKFTPDKPHRITKGMNNTWVRIDGFAKYGKRPYTIVPFEKGISIADGPDGETVWVRPLFPENVALVKRKEESQ